MKKVDKTKPVLQFDDVYFRYPLGHTKQKPWLLEKINFSVYEGEKIGIIGDNGSGKSTIAKLALGIYKPVSGRIDVFGHPVDWKNHYPDLGYIGDPGYNVDELGLPTDITVRQAIDLLAMLLKNFRKSYDIYNIADRLELTKIFRKNVKSLSTGERKRLMSCFALTKAPKILILDEPTDGLDEQIKPVLKDLIKELLSQFQVSLIFISHNRIDIDTFTDKVFRVKEGCLIPEPQKKYLITVSHNGASEEHKAKKLGEVQAIIENLLLGNSIDSGFSLKVNASTS